MKKNSSVDFESIIKSQRKSVITDKDMIRTIKQLPSEYMVDYLEFLEQNYPDKISKKIGEKFLRRLGSKNKQFIEKWAPKLTSVVLKKLEKLVLARADNLLNVYLNLILPDEFLNEFVLLKAKRINKKFRGHYHNALAMIGLAVELNRVKRPDDLFDKFLEMEERYLEENYPNVDINTFYKLVTPMLRRYSVKKGPEEFYDLRNKVLKELRKHGVNPGHLSIEILERRGKHRIQEPKDNYYHDMEFF